MDVMRFLKGLDGFLSRRFFLITGEEDYLRGAAVSRLLEALPLGQRELNCTHLPPKAALAQLRDVAEQLPCFAERRAVVLEESELLTKGDGKAVVNYLKGSNELTAILFVSRQEPDKRRALSKFLAENAVVVTAAPLAEADLLRWLATSARRRGFSLARPEALLLCRLAGTDMLTLLGELDKLAALGHAQITREDILALASHTTEYDALKFHDLMLEGKAREAFAIIGKMRGRRSGERDRELASFMALIAANILPMAQARYCLSCGMSDRAAADELVSAYKMHPYRAKLAVESCKRFSGQHLRRAVRLLERQEVAGKTGASQLGLETTLLLVYGLA